MRSYQAPHTCEECEAFFVVPVEEERGDLYPKLEECPDCRAPLPIDILLANVTELRLW